MILSLYPAPVPSQLQGLPDGIDGIRATLRAMVTLTRQGQRDVSIVTLARQVINQAVPHSGTSKDYAAQMKALQHFVRDRIRYVRDPENAEMVQTPKRTLEIGTGDCDDKSVLLAALLASVGFKTRFVALALKNTMGVPSHVLVEVKLGTRWIPNETILKGIEPGWYPPDVEQRMEAHVSR